MADATPRVVSAAAIDSVRLIDGGLAAVVDVRTPDDQLFAVIMSATLAAELKQRLADALAGPEPGVG